jgi:hypothetical protein
MNINMIEKKSSDCKYEYVEIFTRHVGSIGASSRRTIFIRGTNTKRCEVLNITSRDRKINIFQEESAEFKALDLNKNKGDSK